MKRFVIMGLCCLGILAVFSGSVYAKGHSSAKKAIKEYYNAWYAMDAQKAYDLLAQADKNEMTLEQFIGNFNFNDFEEKLIRAKSSYKIASVMAKGDAPYAEMKFIVPENPALFERAFSIMESFKSHNMTQKQVEDALLKQIKKEKIPSLEMIVDIKLIKDAEGWHVFYDWATGKKVLALTEQGHAAYYAGSYIAALALYEEALKLDPHATDAAEGRAKAEIEAKAMAARLDYLNQFVEIFDVEAKVFTVYGKSAPGVKFKLRNNGAKSLNSLRVKISFLDADGKVLNESRFDVIGMFDAALKPNEVWKERSNRVFQPSEAKSWQAQWQKGSVAIEFIDARLTD